MLVVFGAINMDMSFRVDALPAQGGVATAPFYEMAPGGKAANQSLAALRAGAKVAVVGRVGKDAPGERVLFGLKREGVMTSGVGQMEMPTGTTVIVEDHKGRMQKIVATGANAEATADQVPDEILRKGNVLLLQTELREQENWTLLERAKACGAITILNLAPAIKIPQKALSHVDYLVVNQAEGRQIAEILGLDAEENTVRIAQALGQKGNLTCIVTKGAQGSVAVTPDGVTWSVDALKLEDMVDITGAGDCYCGTLAACLHEGMALPRAMKRASVAASLSCRHKGVHNAYPYSGDIDDHINKIGDPEQGKTG